MIPILADAAAVPTWAWGTGFAAAVMVSLWAIAAGMNQLDEFFARRKDQPSGAEVRIEAIDKFVHKREFDALVQANNDTHDAIFRKIGGVERGMIEKIDALRKEMHEMEHRLTDASDERIRAVHSRIDELGKEFRESISDMPLQVVTLLRNTGAIK